MTLFPALAGVLARCVGYAPSSASYRDAVESTAGLVSYWPLNEPNGATVAVDRGGGVRDLAYGGAVLQGLPALTEDPSGDTSVDFGGTGHASAAHNAAWELADYTVAFAFVPRVAPAAGSNQVLFSKDKGPSPAGGTSIEVYHHTTNGLRLRAYAGGPSGASWIGDQAGPAPLVRGRAHHGCLTVHSIDGAKLYLDGVEVASAPGNTQGWQSNPESFVVAAYGSGALSKLNGLVQHVALWNRALEASEVARLARASTPTIVYGDAEVTAVEDGDPVTIDVLANDVYPAGSTVVITSQPALRGADTVVDAQQRIIYAPPVSGTGSASIGYRVDPGGATGMVDVTVSAAAAAGETIEVAQFEIRSVRLAAGDVAEVVAQPGGLTRLEGAKVYARRASEVATDVGRLMVAARGRPGDYPARVRLTGGAEVDVTVRVLAEAPSSTVRYVRPDGDDGARGDSWTNAWRSWTKAITSAPANSMVVFRGRLSDGRNAVYNVPVAGQTYGPQPANANVTFVTDPEDVRQGFRAMVWAEGDRLRDYLDALNTGKWEVYQDLGPAHGVVYRTVRSDLPKLRSYQGHYLSKDGRWRKLAWYGHDTQSTAIGLTRITDTGYGRYGYYGPGLAWHGGRLYIRLGKVSPKLWGGTVYPSPADQNPAWPPSGRAATEWLPVTPAGAPSADPNQLQLYIGGNDGGTSASTTALYVNGRSGIKLKNLDIVGFAYAARLEGTVSAHECWGVRFIAQCMPSLKEDGGHSGNAYTALQWFSNSGTISGFLADRCEFWGGLPEWVSYGGLKGNALPELSCRTEVLFPNHYNGWSGTVRHCLIDGFWRWQAGGTKTIDWHHNEYVYAGHIDGGGQNEQILAPECRIRCLFWNSSIWGAVPQEGSSWANAGKLFEGFNLQVQLTPCIGAGSPQYYSASDDPGWGTRGHDFPHSNSDRAGHPKTKYHNTVLVGTYTGGNAWSRGTGCNIEPLWPWHTATDSVTGAAAFHRTFNNIYACIPGPAVWTGKGNCQPGYDTAVGFYYHRVGGEKEHDGNHLFRCTQDSDGRAPITSGRGKHVLTYLAYDVPRGGGQNILCATIAELRSASAQTLNGVSGRQYETSGSGGSGAVGSAVDPFVGPLAYPKTQDDRDIAPLLLRSDGLATTGAVNVSGLGIGVSGVVGGKLWDYDGNTKVALKHRAYRGCMAPGVAAHEQQIGPL